MDSRFIVADAQPGARTGIFFRQIEDGYNKFN